MAKPHAFQETLQRTPTITSNLPVATKLGKGQMIYAPVQGHGAPTQSEQITTTERNPQTHKKSLPCPQQAHTEHSPHTSESLPATLESFPATRRRPRSPIPPRATHEERPPMKGTTARHSPPSSHKPRRSPPKNTLFTNQTNQYAKSYYTIAQDRSHQR
jgi:hypothetical protein